MVPPCVLCPLYLDQGLLCLNWAGIKFYTLWSSYALSSVIARRYRVVGYGRASVLYSQVWSG